MVGGWREEGWTVAASAGAALARVRAREELGGGGGATTRCRRCPLPPPPAAPSAPSLGRRAKITAGRPRSHQGRTAGRLSRHPAARRSLKTHEPVDVELKTSASLRILRACGPRGLAARAKACAGLPSLALRRLWRRREESVRARARNRRVSEGSGTCEAKEEVTPRPSQVAANPRAAFSCARVVGVDAIPCRECEGGEMHTTAQRVQLPDAPPSSPPPRPPHPGPHPGRCSLHLPTCPTSDTPVHRFAPPGYPPPCSKPDCRPGLASTNSNGSTYDTPRPAWPCSGDVSGMDWKMSEGCERGRRSDCDERLCSAWRGGVLAGEGSVGRRRWYGW